MTQFVHRSKQNRKKKKRERERLGSRRRCRESDPSAAAGPQSRHTPISRVTLRCCFHCRTNAAFCQLEPSVHVWSQTFCCLCPSVCSSAVFCCRHRCHGILLNYSLFWVVWHLPEPSGGTRYVSMKCSQDDVKTLVAL